MKRVLQLLEYRKLRFVLVGIGNTLFNFVILNFCFYALGTGKILSSIIATICAVTLSFFLNRNFVFRHANHSWHQPIMFVIVTITGVLLIQNVVYAFFVALLRDHTTVLASQIHTITGIQLAKDFIDINVSNFIASLCSMFWNYNGYRLFVFKDPVVHHEPGNVTSTI